MRSPARSGAEVSTLCAASALYPAPVSVGPEAVVQVAVQAAAFLLAGGDDPLPGGLQLRGERGGVQSRGQRRGQQAHDAEVGGAQTPARRAGRR